MSEAEFSASKALWLKCFPEDDAAFVDWYYARRSRPEYALGAFTEGGAPISMLHIIPMDMLVEGASQPVGLVSGVCTDPEMRGRGLCSALFPEAFRIMRERGYAASVLQPFDTAFYERFGYKTFAYRDRYVMSDSRMKGLRHSYERYFPDPGLLFDIYSSFIASCSGCSPRSKEYFEGFVEEYGMKGAYLAVDRNACCAGYMERGAFTATELFYREGELFSALALLPRGARSVAFPLPPDPEIREKLAAVFPGLEPFAADEPFCMAAPVCGAVPGGERCYLMDRY